MTITVRSDPILDTTPAASSAEPGASWFVRLFCRHRSGFTLTALGSAVIGDGTVALPAVEIRCARCGEFWHAELDASEAVGSALKSDADGLSAD